MEADVDKMNLLKVLSDILLSPERSHIKIKNEIDVYEIIPQKRTTYDNSLARAYVLWPEVELDKETVNLMLIGETGKGKTTLINGFLNFLVGVQCSDEHRLSVPIENVDENKYDVYSQTELLTDSQTELLTVYKIPYVEGMPYKKNFVVIDTPGLLDTRGQEVQKMNVDIIKDFIEIYIHKKHMFIGIVLEADLDHCIRAVHLGKEIGEIISSKSNVSVLSIATFADIFIPTCHSVLENVNIKLDNKFKINNSVFLMNTLATEKRKCKTWENQTREILDYVFKLKKLS